MSKQFGCVSAAIAVSNWMGAYLPYQDTLVATDTSPKRSYLKLEEEFECSAQEVGREDVKQFGCVSAEIEVSNWMGAYLPYQDTFVATNTSPKCSYLKLEGEFEDGE